MSFNATEEAEALRKAVRGLGTDDDALIKIISRLTADQRDAVACAYEKKYKRSLVEDVNEDTTGRYRQLLEKLLLPRSYSMSMALHETMEHLGTDDYQLITLMACFPHLVPEAVTTYKKMFKTDLVADIKSEASGDYRDTLVALAERKPPVEGFVDAALVPVDVEALYKAGEKRLGTDDKVFISILTQRSPAHIAAVNKAYEKEHGNSLIKIIEKEMSGNMERLMKALATPKYEWMAQAVEHACKGLGTEERLLHIVFAFCTREELRHVADEYKRLYKKDIIERIKDETSFNFQKLLVALLG